MPRYVGPRLKSGTDAVQILQMPSLPQYLMSVLLLTSALPCAYSFTVLRRAALPMTLTEDKAMAAAAMMGESRMPKNG